MTVKSDKQKRVSFGGEPEFKAHSTLTISKGSTLTVEKEEKEEKSFVYSFMRDGELPQIETFKAYFNYRSANGIFSVVLVYLLFF